jgi:magnesium-transporting ATPase (P-type)
VLAEKIGRYDKAGPTQMESAKKSPNGYGQFLMNGVQEVATLEFEMKRKCMSTIVKGYAGLNNNQVLLKGAPELVLDKCSRIHTQSGQEVALDEAAKTRLKQKIKTVAEQGLRILGIAIALDGGNMKEVTL